MEATIGFNHVWWCFCHEAPILKMYREIYHLRICQCVLGSMGDSSDGFATIPTLHKVVSASLNPAKPWFALNSSLCCTKPSTFVSSASAKLFSNEYALIRLQDLRGEDGSPASSKWFSNNGWSEKVHVATAFGLLLGILRLKSLDSCPFLDTRYFQSVVSTINATAFNYQNYACSSHERGCSGTESPELVRLKDHVAALEAQLSSAAKGIAEISDSKGENLLDTPPSTPSPPKSRIPPKCGQSPPASVEPGPKKRTIADLKMDDGLNPTSKKKKVRQTATEMMKQIQGICDSNGESLGSVLGECCLLPGKENGAREAVSSTLDLMVKEKGARTAFTKLVSEEAWEKRIECMRMPDWFYLLYKLKSRTSDSGWQYLTNLTKLGRTGVSSYFFLSVQSSQCVFS